MGGEILSLAAATGGPGTAGLAALADSGGALGAALLRGFGVLAGLMGLLVLGLHLARRFRWTPAASAPLIRVLATYPLAPRQALWVVAVDRQRFLLASSADRVDFLTPLMAPPESGSAAPPREEGA